PSSRVPMPSYLSIASTDGSDHMYTDVRSAIMRRFPECNMLSHYQVGKRTKDMSGVVEIFDDSCINSCHAFSGFLRDRFYDKC
ncbi:hypothetical protein PENSPDRAFT_593640, partial [Peniophora sp. CONT]